MAAGRDYDFRDVERRWRARWATSPPGRVDVTTLGQPAKFYNLVEFPYPSGEGLHVGHAYTYCGADCHSRYQRMHGRTVFQPMGFDSFGIHTENYALRVGEHPMRLTERTIAHFRGQLDRVGVAWNWDQQVVTSDPSYYRWTQWIFVQLFRAGLAVYEEAPVVWCPSCLTVLANEQLEGDRCERCGTEVTQRLMRQWFFRITAYADRLLEGLDHLDWPEQSKTLQREWIGRVEATEIDFAVEGRDGVTVTAFTTRPDTVFGATFLVLAPDHPLAAGATLEGGERGRPTGLVAINPANGAPIPIWLADYVVAGYGTGAVMGVAGHDARDHEFATAMGLPIVRVVEAAQGTDAGGAYTGEGRLVRSGSFDGMDTERARDAITEWLAERGRGRRAVHYHLRDWLISRQRYWGPPIPIVHCPACGPQPVPEDELPVLLPYVEDFRPTGTGLSPLAAVPSFVETACPRCGGPGRRETDVSDVFVDSSWYFLRYPSADVHDRPWDEDRTRRILPVDLYAGGLEHVVRHHLYARFVTHALHDLGHVPFAEPFPHLRLHGLLLKDGAKMSKSRGNVIDPDHYLDMVGVDNLRMYLLFCGDWQEGGDFSDRGLKGITRFTARLWRLLTEEAPRGAGGVDLTELHRATARIQDDLERLKFNTAIARLMELARWAGDTRARMSAEEWNRVARTVTLLLAPLAPFLAEEAWARLGGAYSVHTQAWPDVDREALREATFQLVVQIDGRVRDRVEAPRGISREAAVELALGSPRVRDHLDGRAPRDAIYVPGRLVNLVS